MKNLLIICLTVFVITKPIRVFSQDRIVFVNGKSINVKIQSQTTDQIYCTYSDDSKLKNYVISKIDIAEIYYAGKLEPVHLNKINPLLSNQDSVTIPVILHTKRGIYNCWVYGDSTFFNKVRKGFVKEVADTGIYFSFSQAGNSFLSKNRETVFLSIPQLESVELRRINRPGLGLFIGAGAGFLFGATIGWISTTKTDQFDNFNASYNSAYAALIGTPIGAIIGAIIGSQKTKFLINRSKTKYQMQKEYIAQYGRHLE